MEEVVNATNDMFENDWFGKTITNISTTTDKLTLVFARDYVFKIQTLGILTSSNENYRSYYQHGHYHINLF